MMTTHIMQRLSRAAALLLTVTVAATVAAQSPAPNSLDKLLDRASQRISEFLDQFSNVKCTEQVTQQKLRPDGKVEIEQQSTFDYLVMLTNNGGDLTFNESRLPIKEAKVERRQPVSMLLTNGFSTLFLVFHPTYINNFEFTDAGEDMLEGRHVRKIQFQHVHNTRSIAALALRGREYPLELSGTAWLDQESGDILKLEAGIGTTLADVGMKTLASSVSFAAVTFSKDQPAYWFPAEAVVEVETPKQHWKNIHRFSTYKQFSVSTEEHVAQK